MLPRDCGDLVKERKREGLGFSELCVGKWKLGVFLFSLVGPLLGFSCLFSPPCPALFWPAAGAQRCMR